MWRAWRDVFKPACGVWDHERKNTHKLKGLCRVLDHVDVGPLTMKFCTYQKLMEKQEAKIANKYLENIGYGLGGTP